jgi:hypothetical protein
MKYGFISSPLTTVHPKLQNPKPNIHIFINIHKYHLGPKNRVLKMHRGIPFDPPLCQTPRPITKTKPRKQRRPIPQLRSLTPSNQLVHNGRIVRRRQNPTSVAPSYSSRHQPLFPHRIPDHAVVTAAVRGFFVLGAWGAEH